VTDTPPRRPSGNAHYADRQAELRRFSQPRRGLRRAEAATYIGVSVAAFDELVRTGLMPQPKAIPGVETDIWDVDELDLFFTALPAARAAHRSRSPSV
jgi:hypothetical protein